ncbi:hypothetical protein L2E82_38197 [Cichorium intybus]|uniref:Uncharacterized protein n=1 Tax=Cichorium intybus TaxID=13427 RepID=A0ACB9AHC4_CICIN|nr:hypothetical protein L2E82_38197 [Cichorium intybus]
MALNSSEPVDLDGISVDRGHELVLKSVANPMDMETKLKLKDVAVSASFPENQIENGKCDFGISRTENHILSDPIAERISKHGNMDENKVQGLISIPVEINKGIENS